MEEGKKFDEGKPRMSLLPYQPLLEVVKVLEFGAKKYGDWNWRGGMDWLRLADATLRHVFAWIGGEDEDKESGINHLAHAVCDLLFLLQYRGDFPNRDNRYRKVSKSGGEFVLNSVNYAYAPGGAVAMLCSATRPAEFPELVTRKKATCGDCDFYPGEGKSCVKFPSLHTHKAVGYCLTSGRINGKECPDGFIPASDS